MKKSTITIVVPVFNVENFVNETLLSIKNQISQADEVIVINDGSTDDTQTKIELAIKGLL